jgi:S1-C subfamily serine protease
MAMQDYSGYGQPPVGPTMPMPPMPPRPPRRRVGAVSYLLVALAAGALGAGSVVALYHPASNNSASASPQPSSSALNPTPLPTGATPLPSSSSPSTSAGEQAIVNKVAPGLVIINTALQYNSEQAAATGMVISPDGLVLTNNHVIEDSTSITARTANGHQYRAKVVGYDVTGDIALIQLQGASGLKTVPIGNSSSVKTGDSVVGMGNAEGQNAIVPVTGQVTALNQTINDGGFSVQQNSSGYSIPIDTALAVAGQITQGQASSTVTIGYPPFMGIYIGQGSNSDPQAQAEQQNGGNAFGGNGFGGNGNQNCYTSDRNLAAPQNIANVNSGTLILGTICGGPAMAAGMTAGSVITAVNGQAVGSPESLTGMVSKFRPGTTIKVTWVSPSGQRSTSSLKLTAGPPL